MADAAADIDSASDLVLRMEDYNYRGTPGKPKSKQDEGNDIEVRVYDAGDNTPCVSCILGGPYYGQNCSETGACSPTED